MGIYIVRKRSENMEYTLTTLFITFMFYSIVGWMVESIYVYTSIKRFMPRGFLIGPYCPIYGFGCLFFITLLNKYMDDPLVLFVLAIAICSVLEYITSWLMEKLFKARWWDYSHKKFNLNGRICLENMMGFGVGALIIMYIVHPTLLPLFTLISPIILNIIAIVLAVIFIADIVLSFKIITSFKNIAKSIHKDSTEEITKKVKEKLVAMGGLYKRLVSSFEFEASENLLNTLKARMKNEREKARKKFKEDKKRLKLLHKKEQLEKELKEVEEEITNK